MSYIFKISEGTHAIAYDLTLDKIHEIYTSKDLTFNSSSDNDVGGTLWNEAVSILGMHVLKI